MKVRLWLRVESLRNNGRGKGQSLESIERYLERYQAKKPDPEVCEYWLTIPYSREAELDEIVYDLMAEAERIAQSHRCFTESDVTSQGPPYRNW